MKLLSEEFEYLSKNLTNPMNVDFNKYDYASKEYKDLEIAREYFNLMLNSLGALGWEVITTCDDSYDKKNNGHLAHTVIRFLFKRSSRSKHYRTGAGIDEFAINREAKERAERAHIN